MHEEDMMELLRKIRNLKETNPERYEEIMAIIDDEDMGGGHRSYSQLKSLLKPEELSENLKAIVREAYEAACMECGYEESVQDESVESKDDSHRAAAMGVEEALEEYLAEAKKSMRLGQGGRFEKLVDKLKSQGKSEESAKAIAASVGRKKYGKAKMAQWAKAGQKRAAKEE
jgi:hypothetical protein